MHLPLYVTVDDEAQTSAHVLYGELCADQQSAGEAGGSDDDPSEEIQCARPS